MSYRVPIRPMTVLPSAARTVATVSKDVRNQYHRGVRIITDVTALTATGTLTVTIQGKSSLPGSADYYTLLAGATITAVGEQVLTVYPGVTETANVDFSAPLPPIFRVSVAVGNAVSITYSCHVEMMP